MANWIEQVEDGWFLRGSDADTPESAILEHDNIVNRDISPKQAHLSFALSLFNILTADDPSYDCFREVQAIMERLQLSIDGNARNQYINTLKSIHRRITGELNESKPSIP